MSTENLVDYHPGTTSALPKKSSVRAFNDPLKGRVVAASSSHIVYTLKDGMKLRIVSSQASNTNSLSFDRHTSAVTKICFMTTSSSSSKYSVVASCSKAELCVWMIVDEQVHLSLILDNSKSGADGGVSTFCWTEADSTHSASFSNLAVVTGSGKVLNIAAAALLQSNLQGEEGTVCTTPQKEVKITSENFKVVSSDAVSSSSSSTSANSILVEAAPALVVTSSATAAAVIRSGVSTKWEPADGAEIVDMTTLHHPMTNTVVVAAKNAVTFWDVALDTPTKLLRLELPASLTALKIEGANKRLVVVVGNAEADVHSRVEFACIALGTQHHHKELTVRGMTLSSFEMADTTLSFNKASCFVTANTQTHQQHDSKHQNEDPIVVMDGGKTLSIYTVPSWYNKPQQQQQQQHQAAPPGYDVVPVVPASASADAGSMPIPAPNSAHNQQQAGGAFQFGNQNFQNNNNANSATASLLSQIKIGGNGAGGGNNNNRQQLVGSEEFDFQLEPFRQRIGQRAQVVHGKAGDLTSVLPQDHEQLLHSVLDGQRETILSRVRDSVVREMEQFRASRPQQVVTLDEEASAQISEVVIRGVSDGIVESVAKGISEALNVQLARRVEQLVQKNINQFVKRLKRQQDKEGNKNAEAVAGEILGAAKDELEKKQKDYGMQLLYQLQQLTQPATLSLQKMQKTIESQQKFIDKFSNSGLLEEIQRLRDEVVSLKSASTVKSRPSSLSMLARAKEEVARGNFDSGIQCVLQLRSPGMTYQLFSDMDENKLEEMTETTSIPQELWEAVANDLAQNNDPEQLKRTCEILQTICTSDDISLNSQVKSNVAGWVDLWKKQGSQLPSAVKSLLQEISVGLKG